MIMEFVLWGRGKSLSKVANNIVTEKTSKGYQKMTAAQLIYLAQFTRYHDLTGEPIGPWCPICMQKSWINEETPGYFRWHQNDQSGPLAEMCKLIRN